MISSDLTTRMRSLERRVQLLLAVNIALVACLGVVMLSGFTNAHQQRFLAVDSLSVRDLVVLDSGGTVRARLSAKMPDAIIRGRRVRRGEDAAGLMLYDDLGQERGGYVTFTPSRAIALTLDTRFGQVASFAADSSGGAALGLFQAGDRLEVRVDSSTGTGLYVWRQRSLAAQLPPLTTTQEAKVCSELQGEVAAARAKHAVVTDEQIQSACELHMSGAACARCLGKKP